MYYLKFSDNKVFNSAVLNTSLNQIFTFLINNLGEHVVIMDLLLDGDIARSLQNIPFQNQIVSVDMITSNAHIFNFLQSSYSFLDLEQVLLEQTCICFTINGFLFKIRYTDETLSSVAVNGIFVKSFN